MKAATKCNHFLVNALGVTLVMARNNNRTRYQCQLTVNNRLVIIKNDNPFLRQPYPEGAAPIFFPKLVRRKGKVAPLDACPCNGMAPQKSPEAFRLPGNALNHAERPAGESLALIMAEDLKPGTVYSLL